jgi:hypothetical protein
VRLSKNQADMSVAQALALVNKKVLQAESLKIKNI